MGDDTVALAALSGSPSWRKRLFEEGAFCARLCREQFVYDGTSRSDKRRTVVAERIAFGERAQTKRLCYATKFKWPISPTIPLTHPRLPSNVHISRARVAYRFHGKIILTYLSSIKISGKFASFLLYYITRDRICIFDIKIILYVAPSLTASRIRVFLKHSLRRLYIEDFLSTKSRGQDRCELPFIKSLR